MTMQQVQQLHDRAWRLEWAERHYSAVVWHLKALFEYPDSENRKFAKRLGRETLEHVEWILAEELRPKLHAAWHRYLRLYGFSLEDKVRIENEGESPIELAPTKLTFTAPYLLQQWAWLSGFRLKANKAPGRRRAGAPLWPDKTKVTTLR
jgi:hypothetical protein